MNDPVWLGRLANARCALDWTRDCELCAQVFQGVTDHIRVKFRNCLAAGQLGELAKDRSLTVDDLVSVAITRVIEKWDKSRDWVHTGKPFAPWFWRTVNNRVIDTLRAIPGFDVESLDLRMDAMEEGGKLPDGPVSPPRMKEFIEKFGALTESTAEIVERRLLLEQVIIALPNLRPEHATALLLVKYHGLSYEEAASVLGYPVNTVKSWVSRAIKHLSRIVGERR